MPAVLPVSRRSFLTGAVSLAALSGCRSAYPLTKRPNLRLGVLADIHISAEDGDFGKFGDAEVFKHALKWFRDQDVDGVIVAGDLCENGVVSQLKKVAEAWYEVFPGDRGRDGGIVAKLFINGNHDVEGQYYDKFADRFHEKESFKADWVASDVAGVWERLFNEPYEPIWLKRVKGYQVIGAHWDTWKGISSLEKWVADHDGEIDRDKPFFYIQHALPKDTCYGERAWGQDDGSCTRAFSTYPNAISICGHTHYGMTDDRFIWLGDFTSIQCPSLRYGSFSGTATLNPKGTKLIYPPESKDRRLWKMRQGMMIDVYDTEVKIICRDFHYNDYVRDDIVLPVPFRKAEFAERAARFPLPAFGGNAKLAVKQEKEKWVLQFPAVKGEPRTVEYIIKADVGGKVEKFFAAAPDFELCTARARKIVTVELPLKDVPEGAKFKVSPVDCYGREGAEI